MKKNCYLIIIVPWIVSLFFTTTAYAEPTYLECKVVNENNIGKQKYLSFSVKADEANGKITHTDSDMSFNEEGFFSANTIKYRVVVKIGANEPLIVIYTINRTTLDVIQEISLAPLFPDRTYERAKGSCQVVKVKDRKI